MGCRWNQSQGQGAREPRLCHARIQFQMGSVLSPASPALTAAQPFLHSPKVTTCTDTHSPGWQAQEGKLPNNPREHIPKVKLGGHRQLGCCQPCVYTHLYKVPQPGTLLSFKTLPARKCTFQPPATPETKNELKGPAEN